MVTATSVPTGAQIACQDGIILNLPPSVMQMTTQCDLPYSYLEQNATIRLWVLWGYASFVKQSENKPTVVSVNTFLDVYTLYLLYPQTQIM